jgi:hypothetical protein
MPYKISGTIIEAIFDDKARLIRLAPKKDEFHVTEISEEEAKIVKSNGECVSEKKGENGNEGKIYCTTDAFCEANMPPWYPLLRKCITDSHGNCICQYVYGPE